MRRERLHRMLTPTFVWFLSLTARDHSGPPSRLTLYPVHPVSSHFDGIGGVALLYLGKCSK